MCNHNSNTSQKLYIHPINQYPYARIIGNYANLPSNVPLNGPLVCIRTIYQINSGQQNESFIYIPQNIYKRGDIIEIKELLKTLIFIQFNSVVKDIIFFVNRI